MAQVGRVARLVHAQPVLIKGQRGQILANAPEAMHVALADAAPVAKLDAELEGGARFAHEGAFVDLQQLVEQPDHGNGRLAHADRSNVV